MLVMYKIGLVQCNWIQFIESTLNKLGTGYIWFNQCVGKNFLWQKNNTVTQSLSEQSRQEWNFDVNNLSSCCINFRLSRKNCVMKNI